MALADHIGLAGPEYEVDIERGKIREFARAMAAPLPEFTEGRHPVIPATFLVSAPYTWGYTLERPRGTVFETIGFDPAVSLHGEEEFRFFGPMLKAGDRLVARSIIEDIREKRGASGGKLTFAVTLTQYRGLDGVLRAEQRTTSVATEQTPGSQDWNVDLPQYHADYRELDGRRCFDAVERACFSDLAEGEGPGPIHAGPLMLQDIVRFQGVVGEDNALHHDADWARQNGYPDVFALGMHQASMLASYAGHWLPPEAVRSFKVRFHKVYWPGDRLVYAGRVAGLDSAARIADLYLTTTRENGDLVNEVWMQLDFNHR
ncbi:MAG: MaoC family dehydratase N-terminal domain-containing protein [Rhizobiaceae bacterium]